MARPTGGGIQLVDVTTDIFSNGVAKKQLWAAAVARDLAVGIVLGAVPEGWTAALATTRLTPNEVALLKMGPGEVREMRGSSEKSRAPRASRKMV